MKVKKSIKIIGATLVVLLIIIGIISNVDKNLHVNEVKRVNTNTTTIDDPSLGQWTLTGSWSNPNNKTNLDINGDLATIDATSTDIDDNELGYNIAYHYEAGTAGSMFYGGDIYIDFFLNNEASFPFKMRDSLRNLTWTQDVANNRLNLTKRVNNEDIVVSYVSLNDIQNCNNNPSGTWCWTYRANTTTLELLTLEDVEVDMEFSGNLNISFFVNPIFAVGDVATTQAFSPGVYILNEDGDDGVLDDNVNTTLHTMVDTHLELTNVVKAEPIVSDVWVAAWGSNPRLPDVIYVMYSVDASILATTPFNTDNGSVTFIPTFQGGQIVGFSDGSTTTMGDINSFNNNLSFTLPNNDNNVSSYNNISNSMPTTTDFTRTFIVAYPKDEGVQEGATTKLDVRLQSPDAISPVEESIVWEVQIQKENYPEGFAKEVTHELVDDQVGIGAASSLSKDQLIRLGYTLESDADTINALENGDLVKAFNYWNATNEGTKDYTLELETSKLTIGSSYTDSSDEVTLGAGDYKIVSIVPIDDAEYNYKKIDDYYVLEPNNIANYAEKEVYVKINNGSLEKIGTIKKDGSGNIVYTATSDKTVSVASVDAANPIVLPNSTTYVELKYTGKLAALYMGYDMNIELLPSTNVKNILENLADDGNNMILKNYGVLKANNTVETTKVASTYLTNLESDTALLYSSRVTKGTNKNTITYNATIEESVFYADDMEDLAKEYLAKQQNSKFYMLLQQGATLNEGTVVRDVNGNEVTTNITQTPSYQGTNRTLVTVEITNDEVNMLADSNIASSSYDLSYSITYLDTANRDYGNRVLGDLAYYSDSKLSGGVNSASNANDLSFSSPSVKTAFSNLGSGKKKFIFETNAKDVDAVASDFGNARVSVQVPGSADFVTDSKVKQGSDYKYKLEYDYTDPLADISNLVIYDFLENNNQGNTAFKGTLKSVDTEALEALGINPTVYYSDNVSFNFNEARTYDLTKAEIWTTDRPADMSTVTAIAVDCGDYEFLGNNIQTPIVYLNMTASFNNNDVGAKAYNNSVMKFNTLGESDTITSNTTTLELESSSIELNVTTKTNITGEEIGNGTLADPVYIRKNLGYLLTVTNPDSIGYSNVLLHMTIDGLVNVDTTKLQYYYGDDLGTRTDFDQHVTYDNTDGLISILVDNIPATSKINIFVPVKVRGSELTVDNANINSTSSIVRLNTIAFQGTEAKTYHKASIPNISATHSTKTVYNENIFIDDYTYVEKGETISNQVKITNQGSIAASGITVVETITNGSVDTASITNDGVYDSNNKTITWTIAEMEAGAILELSYDLAIPANVNNNTYFNTSTHVTVTNPYDETTNILDSTLDQYDVVYRTNSDVKITNTLAGPLANHSKKFEYTIAIDAEDYAKGKYKLVYINNGVETPLDDLELDNNGDVTYSFNFEAEGSLLVRGIPGGYKVTITQSSYPGYTTTITDREINNMSIEETIDENTDTHLRTYDFVNTYSASTTQSFVATTNYDKELVADMFEVEMNDGTTPVTKTNNAEGKATFDPITYTDEVGTHTYTFSLKPGTNDRINYSNDVITATVKITDKGDGTLKKDITYKNRLNETVSSISFDSKWIPVGLFIQNVHTGDYVNPNKKFKYKVNVSSDDPVALNTTYKVVDKDGNELDDFTLNDEGKGTYEVELHNDEYIVIQELPVGSTYEIIESKEQYYDSSVKDLEFDNQDNSLVQSGTIEIGTKKVVFLNNYSTKASFAPKAKVVLNDKTLENNEFKFRIKDVDSDYVEEVTNDLDGNIFFKSIDYTRPGTYNYEIEVINTNEPNIKYDTSKLLLTLELVDNEDGTMSVTPTYKYLSGGTSFVNTYSEEPIIDEETSKQAVDPGYNPNTNDFMIGLIVLLFVTVVSVIIARLYKIKKYNN